MKDVLDVTSTIKPRYALCYHTVHTISILLISFKVTPCHLDTTRPKWDEVEYDRQRMTATQPLRASLAILISCDGKSFTTHYYPTNP